MDIEYTIRTKYRALGDRLKDAEGTLLDVGARDGALSAHVDGSRLKYSSADIGRDFDYQIDLEQRIDLPDRVFDYVVALDVLEHVEGIHDAFHELARITEKYLIVALPNMATLSRRWKFLRHGHPGTRKYSLESSPQGDRHRWLTVAPQIKRFIEENALKAGFQVVRVVHEMDGGVCARMSGLALVRMGMVSPSLVTGRYLYILERVVSEGVPDEKDVKL